MCVMDDKREKRQIIQSNKQASQLDVSLAEPVAYPPGNTVYSSIVRPPLSHLHQQARATK